MKKPEQPRVSTGAVRLFAAWSRRLIRRRFHAFRILKSGMPPQDAAGPLIVYANHASWWDPVVGILLSRKFMTGRTLFAPMDAAMLERYGMFKRLGFFSVEQNSVCGARHFLRTVHTVLASPRHVLWLTPQGRFADVRERPLHFQPGLGTLAVREPEAAFVPLAIEYSFWTEPRPEILVSFGQPVVPAAEPGRSAAEWTRLFASALERAQDDLAICSCRRDPAEWRTLYRGKSGVNRLYDAWRWLRAKLRGEKFTPEHQEELRP